MMVQTRQCDFCGTDIEPGTGTMFVFVDGRVVHYCSSKCEKNADLGRVPRDVEWTAEGQRLRQRSQRTVGTQEEVEEVAAEPPEESDSFAEDVDTVPEETEAEAVAAATRDAGGDSDGAAATDATDPESTGRDTDDEEVDEVVGRRAGGDDPDIEEDTDPDIEDSDAETTVEGTDEGGQSNGDREDQEDHQEASQ